MSHLLGTGTNQAFIYDQNGETQLLTLPESTGIEWGRAGSEVSEATVSIPVSDCDSSLGQVHSWAHTLVIFREDGETAADRVWEGPVRRVRDTKNSLVFTARDVLGWGERRSLKVSRQIPAGSPVVTELNWTVGQCFAEHDPNVLAYKQIVGPTGASVPREVAAYAGYVSEDLGNLVGAGGRFTVVGRRIILHADETVLGRTATLEPENHLLADVTLLEDGDSLGTRVIARDDQGLYGIAGGVDAYYGLVEQLVTPGSGNFTRTGLTTYATRTRAQAYPARLQIEVPDGAQLACDAPFPIAHLVPGVLVPLETVTATGRRVQASFVLTSMKVSQQAGSDEQVTISLAPVSTTAVSA